jgi:glucose-fructose oxidoreductase
MPPRSRSPRKSSGAKVRYAVVGLGHIAQVAALPAFAHAKRNSELVALVSDDAQKLRALGRKYRVRHLASYDEYEALLKTGEVDAVYIGLPNHLHRDYAIRAAEAGVHVLCEKPLAVTAEDCESMIETAERHRVKLMTAYRLHFEKANLTAVETVRSGKIGEARFFSSVFSMDVEEGNIRLAPIAKGGGTLYDIGIYCINAARYLFRAEPEDAFAWSADNGEKRFRDCDEMTSAVLRFPGDRLASFVSSFGAAPTATYRIVGTKGDLRMDSAYEYAEPMKMTITVNEKSRERTFPKRDQFAPELIYFSDCIRTGRDPEPSGREGLADVRIIEALYRSAREGRAIRLPAFEKRKRPTKKQEITAPPVKKPELVKVESASGDD